MDKENDSVSAVAQFIEEMYADLSTSLESMRPNRSLSPRNNDLHVDNHELNASDAFSQRRVNQSTPQTPRMSPRILSRPPRRRRNGTARRDRNLSPNIIIDLSEVQTPPRPSMCVTNASLNSSDVILVEQNEVIDLCTPKALVHRRRSAPSNKTSDNIKRTPQILTSTDVPHRKCPICLEAIDQPTATKCGHVYCRSCIYKAISTSRKCPICNVQTYQKDLRRIYI